MGLLLNFFESIYVTSALFYFWLNQNKSSDYDLFYREMLFCMCL